MKRAFVFWAVAVIAGLFVAACGSTPGQGEQTINAGAPEDPFSLNVLSYRDVRKAYGLTFMDNPFMAPSGGITAQANDFIVLRLNFNTPSKASVMLLRAEATDDRGKLLASYMTLDKFAEFAMQQSPDQANNTLKRNKIDWYYLPNPVMTLDAGKHSYVLILVGRHPIPDTGTIHVAFAVDNKATSFDIPVPISLN